MSKHSKQKTLKSYRAPWEGQVLLACGKCQRKLKHGKDEHGLGKLKKALKKRSSRCETSLAFFVINTPCLDVCPKGGVVIATQAQMIEGRFSIFRTADDLDTLYKECAVQTRGGKQNAADSIESAASLSFNAGA